MSAIAARLAALYPPTNEGRGVRLVELQEQLVRDIRPGLLILFGAVAFVLLISCVNVANLLLARASPRSRETAIRTALGASRWQIVRQSLAECSLLAGAGAALGLVFALWGVDVIGKLAASQLPPATNLRLDGTVLAFTAALALATGIGFGIGPAAWAAGVDPQQSLKEGSRGSGGSLRRSRLRSLLVAVEIASAMLLLTGAGLALRSLWSVLHVESGLRPERVLTMRLALPEKKYPTAALWPDSTGACSTA